tara:strand:+ start:674 stop:817 length:144 start_codon:yes stop_codon:yes gene_type:complete
MFYQSNVYGLSKYLNKIKSEGLIVRPDRFIIGAIKSEKISKIKNYSI